MIWFSLCSVGIAFEIGDPQPREPDRENLVRVAGATPGATIRLYRSGAPGTTATRCPLDLEGPELIVQGVANDQGMVRLRFHVPFEWSGQRHRLQAVQDDCAVTRVRPVRWQVVEWLGEWHAEVADTRIRGGQARGVFGSRVSLAGDADGDGTADLLVAAPHESGVGPLSGAVYLFCQPGPGVLHAMQDECARLTGEGPEDWAGIGLAYAGDIDADGHDDVVVGAFGHHESGRHAGAAYLVRMPVTGERSLADAEVVLLGDRAGDQLGVEVAPAGDVNGDGFDDVWVAAPQGGNGAGAVYLVSGTVRGRRRIGRAASAMVRGEAAGDQAGMRLSSLGDTDGDGVPELAVGAEGSDRAGADAGAAYVLSSPRKGVASLADASAVLLGEQAGDRAGASTVAVGDIDGDGLADLGVTARGTDRPGTMFLVTAPFPEVGSLADARTRLVGERAGDWAGAHSTQCDVDGDGIEDLVVGAHHAGPGPQTGRAYLFYGPVPAGDLSLADADAIFMGDESGSNLGQDLSCADLDADGRGDLALGAEGDASDYGGALAGSVYLAFGRPRRVTPGCTVGPGGVGLPLAMLAWVVGRRRRRASGGIARRHAAAWAGAR